MARQGKGVIMTTEFKQKLLSLRPRQPRTVALACATDPHALAALAVAYNMGFINAILCGNETEIKSVASAHSIDISSFRIVHCDDELSAVQSAISLVRGGDADILMKGQVHTADLLRAVLNKEKGIRTPGVLSHVAVLYSPSRNRTLFMTDIAMVMYPDLDKKVQLINNAVSFAHHMGVAEPRVAALCAVETLNPAMPATVDAMALHDMNKAGKINGCIISGPISFDIATVPAAARAKGYSGPIQGNADILLFHNIEAGNNTIKAMVQFGDWIFAGVVLGARAPIVLNSRSDSDASKLYSIACACSMCD